MKTDYEFVADQLTNAWEFMSESEMLEYLFSETGFNDDKMQKLIDLWYSNVKLRIKMELTTTDSFITWLKTMI